mmetsp:Transcript_11479/g.48169  ORF Transcript_11479/g.48169 Transcript_11479/m.48169 type:complete len:210 (+) Transcript_11479:3365-3994(+)
MPLEPSCVATASPTRRSCSWPGGTASIWCASSVPPQWRPALRVHTTSLVARTSMSFASSASTRASARSSLMANMRSLRAYAATARAKIAARTSNLLPMTSRSCLTRRPRRRTNVMRPRRKPRRRSCSRRCARVASSQAPPARGRLALLAQTARALTRTTRPHAASRSSASFGLHTTSPPRRARTMRPLRRSWRFATRPKSASGWRGWRG